jgi:CheY-like chemotaxis protein
MANASTKVTNFPTPAPSRLAGGDDLDGVRSVDPTREILSLVEQLQDTSRDTQARLKMAERERDQLTEQLEKIRLDAEAAEEISRKADDLKRERDRLQDQTSKHGQLISDLKKRVEVAEKAREDFVRERAELIRQRDAAAGTAKTEIESLKSVAARQPELEREIAELRRNLSDMQGKGGDSAKQILSLRQARDAAASQLAEMKAKLASMEDELAEVGYQRDDFEKQAAEAKSIRHELDVLNAKSAADEYRIASLEAKATEHSTQSDAIRAELSKALRERDEHAEWLSRLREEFEAAKSEASSLRDEREGFVKAIAEQKIALENALALEKATKEEVTVLGQRIDDLMLAVDDAEKRSNSAIAERNELAKQLTTLGAESEAALSKANQEKDALAAEVGKMRASADSAKAEIASLLAKAEKSTAEHQSAIEEFTGRLDSLRAAHESELAVARQQNETALKERDTARVRAQEMDQQIERMRSEIDSLKSTISAHDAVVCEKEKRERGLLETIETLQKSEESLRIRTSDAERNAAVADKEREKLALSLDEARNSLIGAQKQMEFVIRDRDTVREKASVDAVGAEALLKESRMEVMRVKKELESVQPKLLEYAMLADRFERQRLDTIELSAQLENAQRDIKEMGASLAEARLAVKNAERRAGVAGRSAQPLSRASDFSGSFPNSRAVSALENSPSKGYVDLLRQTFQNFTRRPGDIGLLNELFEHARNFSEHTKQTGEQTLSRLSVTFASLLNELHVLPELVTPAMLRTVSQTIEFLGALIHYQNLDRVARLDSARVYAVDDDCDICDSINSSLETIGLNAKATQMPGEAVGELAGNRYDLIILDVNLPELDGFELCTHIRNMALHTETPIIFITGNASHQNRNESTARGGNEFLSKPFNVHELGLKSISLILRSRLRLC